MKLLCSIIYILVSIIICYSNSFAQGFVEDYSAAIESLQKKEAYYLKYELINELKNSTNEQEFVELFKNGKLLQLTKSSYADYLRNNDIAIVCSHASKNMIVSTLLEEKNSFNTESNLETNNVGLFEMDKSMLDNFKLKSSKQIGDIYKYEITPKEEHIFIEDVSITINNKENLIEEMVYNFKDVDFMDQKRVLIKLKEKDFSFFDKTVFNVGRYVLQNDEKVFVTTNAFKDYQLTQIKNDYEK